MAGHVGGPMALLSPGGTSMFEQAECVSRLAVGTADGIWMLERADDGDWSLVHHALQGTFVSALVRTADGGLVAGSHHFGLARSDDGGATWRWINKGLDQFDVWVVKAERLDGRDMLFAGTMPARLYTSDDGGDNWKEQPGLGQVATASGWFFPPPPHLGHVKDIVVHEGREVVVGIEVGALLRSEDGCATFAELPLSPDFTDIDVHRVLLHPTLPDRMIVATGWGLRRSDDRGRTWHEIVADRINYPDAMVMHPRDPDLLFVAGAKGFPPNWYKINRARPRLARSRDGGRTWERLLGGFPDGQRAAVGAMSLVASPAATILFVGDTDGQIFESRDGGDSWQIIFEMGAVSKGEHYRGLVKGRAPAADLDNLKFAPAGQKRIDTGRA